MNKMKVLIPTWNRAETISTHKLFHKSLFDVNVLVHNRDQKAAYREGAAKKVENIIVTGVANGVGGLTRQREWGLKNLCKKGEWIVFADDNIFNFGVIQEPWYSAKRLPDKDTWKGDVSWNKFWHQQYGAESTAERLSEVFLRSIFIAEKKGSHLVGFTLSNNPLFNATKWRTGGYVIGKCMLWKYDPDYIWRHDITMEDFYHSAQHIVQYGITMTNRFICPRAGHYEKGGLGEYSERVPHRLKDVKKLMKAFPGYFRIKDRKGFVPGTDLSVCIRATGIDRWRKDFLNSNPKEES